METPRANLSKAIQWLNVSYGVGSQITGLIGGLASYGYDGDFSLGQFGATQVYNFNDSAGIKRKQNPDGTWNVYDLSKGNAPTWLRLPTVLAQPAD